MAVGPEPFNVTYPTHSQHSGNISDAIRRAPRKARAGRADSKAPLNAAAVKAASMRAGGSSPRMSAKVGHTQAAKNRGRARAGMDFKAGHRRMSLDAA